MNKAELINTIAEKTGISRKDTDKVVNCMLDTVMETLCKDEKVALVGFGCFTPKQRVARTGRNPLTGNAIEIKESRACSFKAGKNMKEKLN